MAAPADLAAVAAAVVVEVLEAIVAPEALVVVLVQLARVEEEVAPAEEARAAPLMAEAVEAAVLVY